MEIRKQIKQINIALSGTLDMYSVWAKKHNLNYNALVVLYTLDDLQVCTQKQICNWWGLPKQTVHGILQDFEQKGYIRVVANEENKRERLVSYTEKGRSYAHTILDGLYELEERVMKKMGEDKRQQLVKCNTEYYELLKEEIKNE